MDDSKRRELRKKVMAYLFALQESLAMYHGIKPDGIGMCIEEETIEGDLLSLLFQDADNDENLHEVAANKDLKEI